jgi:hypothetical protein
MTFILNNCDHISLRLSVKRESTRFRNGGHVRPVKQQAELPEISDFSVSPSPFADDAPCSRRAISRMIE